MKTHISTMGMVEMESEAIKIVEKARDKLLATNVIDEKIAYKIDRTHIDINLNMRSCAGKAKYLQQTISLNYRLLKDNRAEFESTTIHELAHLVSMWKYGLEGRAHGHSWQHIMYSLGFSADRCHSLDTKHLKRKQRRYNYKCNCRTYKLSGQRHKAGYNSYSCRSCKGRLQWLGSYSQ